MADGNQTKRSGRTYDMSVKTEVDGKSKWLGLGMVFVRDDGSGGAVFLRGEALANAPKDEKGQIVISLFPHRPRPANGAPKPEAKTQAA